MRADEAWSGVNAVEQRRSGWIPFEWEQVRVEVSTLQIVYAARSYSIEWHGRVSAKAPLLWAARPVVAAKRRAILLTMSMSR
jgi:hypothetical protein